MGASHDYIVVGAGSAGAAVAARLSEDPTRSVLLLEAGPSDRKTEVRIPAAFSKLFKSDLDWDYETEPQAVLGGRRVYWPRGRMLGGSSSINAMMWVRGFPEDYDEWGEAAGSEWSWRGLRRYFDRVEDVDAAIARDDEDAAGRGGAIRIEEQRSPRPHTEAFLAAAEQVGIPRVVPNGRDQRGVSRTLVTQRRGVRFSAVDGYLSQARRRQNLTILTDAQVTRVLFDGTHATGVEYVRDGHTLRADARREVILSGGAINTPQLLMLSGIGDREELARFSIPVIAHSPEVGRNLRDHMLSGFAVGARADTLYRAETPGQFAQYLLRHRGMLTSNVAEAYGFVTSQSGMPLPDLELIFAPAAFIGEGLVSHEGHAVTLGVVLLRPESHGTIMLASADPLVKPLIEPRYLSDPEGRDRAAIMAGLALCQDVLEAPALATVTTDEYIQPAGGERMDREQRIITTLEQNAQTLYHPVGTARMGSDAESVVDEKLRVRGVTGLRVADASIMPSIIRGHTNAPALVIGEKAADIIRAVSA